MRKRQIACFILMVLIAVCDIGAAVFDGLRHDWLEMGSHAFISGAFSCMAAIAWLTLREKD